MEWPARGRASGPHGRSGVYREGRTAIPQGVALRGPAGFMIHPPPFSQTVRPGPFVFQLIRHPSQAKKSPAEVVDRRATLLKISAWAP